MSRFNFVHSFPLPWLCREQYHALILLMGQSCHWPLVNAFYLPARACETDIPYATLLYVNPCAAKESITDIICSTKPKRWNLTWELCNWKWGLRSLKIWIVNAQQGKLREYAWFREGENRISSYYNAYHRQLWKAYMLDRLHVIRMRALGTETYLLNIFLSLVLVI